MEPTKPALSAEHERYIELSRIFGTQTMAIIEQASTAELEARLASCDPGKATLVREAHAIFWKNNDKRCIGHDHLSPVLKPQAGVAVRHLFL